MSHPCLGTVSPDRETGMSSSYPLQTECRIDSAETHAHFQPALDGVRHAAMAYPVVTVIDGIIQVEGRMQLLCPHLQHCCDQLYCSRGAQPVARQRLRAVDVSVLEPT